MRHSELKREDKGKYGPKLKDIIDSRIRKIQVVQNIEDYQLVELGDWTEGWIYYPDIDDKTDRDFLTSKE